MATRRATLRGRTGAGGCRSRRVSARRVRRRDALRREVERLLAQESEAAGFLQASAAAVAAGVLSPAPQSLTGRRLNALEVARARRRRDGRGLPRARHEVQRDVAIKILPRSFTSDPDRLARFEREARMLAALNHPNIGAIYGLEEADGRPALVSNSVDGQTLAERIAGGPPVG